MSIAAQDQIDYPESDGKPMGETDLHRDWMIAILDRLRHRYRGQQVYVASDLLVYYEAGQPTKFIVPDDFVVLDCQPHRRRIFKTWEEQRVPNVVFEVTSRGTSSEDIITKPVIYERMGVKEYFLYDPTAEYLKPALQGYRSVDGTMTVIEPLDGKLQCETLGIELYLDGTQLVMRDSDTQLPLLTEAESERNEKEVERTQREAEQAARLAAEARVRELEAELRRLRDEEGDSAR
jgi:Uma2 family endonuclease